MINIKENEFNLLVSFMKSNYGLDLSAKKNLVEGRLGNVIVEKGFKTYGEYFDYAFMKNNPEEITNLINRLTTNHTYFMRETNHFDFFKDTALPYFTSTIKDRDLRVWSAGCSSGEEPYTLAMIIADYLGEQKRFWDSQILATDISMKVLDTAKKGIYSAESIETLPPKWKNNYLKKIDAESYQFDNKIKNEVIYRTFNLMDEVFPFKKKFHAIFCRNVMIYFDLRTKIELINKFYELTEPGGYLFIGHSESINRDHTGYEYVMPAVYRKG
jgi:chemotaxis protein methyltransferase CheR